jgi:7-cyano-7-deazaguanine reductase
MSDQQQILDTIHSLGSGKTIYENRYNKELLEVFQNPQIDTPYEISIQAPEFTCLCPITGQPDFATIQIEYSPDALCVESKSLKLYLFSFRQSGAFHEDVTNRIARDLFDRLKPHYIEVEGQFMPRGGISFWPKVKLVK